ncbi:primase-helicase family protein [Aliarcobacter lanthieri]|uniref:primase-helicase family protein n=1 Tax=Aliarcobacter lanthieri TaxID=1355374 RepID=UPI00047D21C9|nr:primase-helicase family protein [Aliarcobacter lanthieri]
MINRIKTFTEPILFTEVTANNVDLNKTFELIDGKIKKTANAQMSTGSFRVLQVNNIIDLDNYLNLLASNQAIIVGIPRNNLLQGTIVPRGGELVEYSAISRTNSCFVEAKTSLALFDFDFDEFMPYIMREIKTPQDFYNAVIKIIPELSEVGIVIRYSSSSGIFNTLTNDYVYKDSNSYHMYTIFNNCTKENLDNFIEYFKRKSLQVGLSYAKIYKNGSIGYRTLIDLSPLKSLCSRLIFESKPTVIHPLKIKEQKTIFFNKDSKNVLDLSKFNPNELIDYKDTFEEYKKNLAPQVAEIKAQFIEKKEKELVENGISEVKAKEIVNSFINEGKISCHDFLIRIDGTKIKVLDALLDYSREYYNDIVDESKKSKAYIKRKNIFDAEIFSFSSGGVKYTIDFDFDGISYLLIHIKDDENCKNKYFLSLEKLLIKDVFTPEEIMELEIVLKTQGFLTENNSFCIKVFEEIKDKVILKAMENYAVLLTNGSLSIVDMSQTKLTLYKLSDIKHFFKNRKVSFFDFSQKKYVKISPVDIWMESKNRKEFTDITFDPSNKCKKNVFNLFRGFKYEPKNLIDISLYHDLIKNVICSGDDYMYGIVWSFLAQIIQQPEKKIGVCLVFLSKMGTGKGTAIQPIIELLSGYSFVTSDSDAIFSRFNSHLLDKLFIYYNEASELNYNKSLNSKFKHLITEEHTNYEVKNGPNFMAPNLCRMILDSNEDSLLKESGDSRRTWYTKISEGKIGNKDYFEKLYELYAKPGFYETLMYQLSTFELTPWLNLLRSPIKNEVSLEQQLQSLNEIQDWWLSCLSENRILEAYYELTYDNCLKISNEELYNSFLSFIKKSGKRNYIQKAFFGKMMKKHCISNELITMPNAKDTMGNNAKNYASLPNCWEYFKNKHKLEGHEIDICNWLPPKVI